MQRMTTIAGLRHHNSAVDRLLVDCYLQVGKLWKKQNSIINNRIISSNVAESFIALQHNTSTFRMLVDLLAVLYEKPCGRYNMPRPCKR